MGYFYVKELRQTAQAQSQERILNLRDSFLMATNLSLEFADQAVQYLSSVALQRNLAEFERTAKRLTRKEQKTPIRYAAWIDGTGKMLSRVEQGENQPLLDVKHQDYFRAFMAHQEAQNQVSTTDNQGVDDSFAPTVLFARKVSARNTEDGIVVIGLEIKNFAALASTLRQHDILIALIANNGRVIFRADGVGTSNISTAEKIDISQLPSNANVGIYRNPLDNTSRLSLTQSIPKLGFHLYVGHDLKPIDNLLTGSRGAAIAATSTISLFIALMWFLIRQGLIGRELANEQRQQELQRLQQALDGMAEGVAVLDNRGNVQIANPALRAWFPVLQGAPLMQTIQERGFHLLTDDAQPTVVHDPIAEICLAYQEPVSGLWLSKGATTWIRFTATPLFDNNKLLAGAVVILADQSKEHERIRELAIHETILNQMTDGVILMDANGQITHINFAISSMSAYSPRDLIGLSLFALFGGQEDVPDFAEEVLSTLAGTGRWFGRTWLQRKDGSLFCCAQTISSVKDAQGQLICHVATWRDITEQELQQQQLWHRANYDPLTHLANRQRFEDRLENTLIQAHRHNTAFAVCFLDLDFFKQVNDRLGHAAGDKVLQQVAQRMQGLIRDTDTLARIGGDEFALLAPEIGSADDAIALVSKLVQAIAQPFNLPEGLAKIGLSAGIALYPQHGIRQADLLKAADEAVYQVKANGRNGYVIAPIRA